MTSAKPPQHRSFVWLILVAALAAGVGLWFGSRQFALAPAPKLANAVLYPQPRPVADFELTTTAGKPLTPADWRGHWSVVYFGYTSCPDVCPTTLATFKAAWKQLAAQGLQDRLRLYFISVDPPRDTPQVLHDYVAFFCPDFIGATGSDEQLTTLTRSLGMIYSRTTRADGSIEVDHSGSAVILDPQGREVGLFRPPFTAAEVAGDLAALVGQH